MKETTPPSTLSNQPATAPLRREHYRVAARYHTELARFSTWLFGAIVIAITFLLLAGLRNPHTILLVFMYVAMGSFGLTVLLYPLINLYQGKLMTLAGAQENLPSGKAGKEAAEALAANHQRLHRQLRVLAWIQQAVFVIGVIAVIGFAIETSLYLFVSPTASSAAGAAGAAGAAQ